MDTASVGQRVRINDDPQMYRGSRAYAGHAGVVEKQLRTGAFQVLLDIGRRKRFYINEFTVLDTSPSAHQA